MPLTKAALAGVALAAAVGAVSIGTSPALAADGSTCTYNPDTKSVIVDDHSGSDYLIVRPSLGQIRIADARRASTASPARSRAPTWAPPRCSTRTASRSSAPARMSARRTATRSICARGSSARARRLNRTACRRSRWRSKPRGVAAPIAVDGTEVGDPITHGNDEIRVGAGGQINLGFFDHLGGLDQDVDVTTSKQPLQAYLFGGTGNDFLTAAATSSATTPAPPCSESTRAAATATTRSTAAAASTISPADRAPTGISRSTSGATRSTISAPIAATISRAPTDSTS